MGKDDATSASGGRRRLPEDHAVDGALARGAAYIFRGTTTELHHVAGAALDTPGRTE
jgi:hypothetical protein